MADAVRGRQLPVPLGRGATARRRGDVLLPRHRHHAGHERSEAGHRFRLCARFPRCAGNYLDGGRTYKVTLPGPIPAKNFWAFTVYDNQTRSLLPTDQKSAGLDSNLPGLKKNADGGATIWFGPKAPAGNEANWVQTMPGKGYNVHPAALWAARALVQPDLATGRSRDTGLTVAVGRVAGVPRGPLLQQHLVPAEFFALRRPTPTAAVGRFLRYKVRFSGRDSGRCEGSRDCGHSRKGTTAQKRTVARAVLGEP